MSDWLSNWLRTIHPVWFVLVLLTATYVAVVPLELLRFVMPDFSNRNRPAYISSLGLPGRLLIGSVIAPMVETALFQWAPTRLLHGKFQLPWCYVIFSSASFFAVSHWYSLSYVFFAFLVGLVLAYGFAVRDAPKGRPFVLVWLVHGLRNGVASFML